MMCVSVLYKMCQNQYKSRPLARGPVEAPGTVDVMTMLLPNGEGERFFALLHSEISADPSFQLRSWDGKDQLAIVPDADIAAPEIFSDALLQGVPFPADGSLFGWKHNDEITALMAFYAEYAPGAPEPWWSVMPRADSPQPQWPSLPRFGEWFWKLLDSGCIVDLSHLIASTPDTVFWSDTEPIIGSGCCLVTQDITSDERYTLKRGRYVHHSVLMSGKQLPPVDVLLTETETTDLAPRFLAS